MANKLSKFFNWQYLGTREKGLTCTLIIDGRDRYDCAVRYYPQNKQWGMTIFYADTKEFSAPAGLYAYPALCESKKHAMRRVVDDVTVHFSQKHVSRRMAGDDVDVYSALTAFETAIGNARAL